MERKSRNKLAFGYSSGYYVVTPSKWLHEFKDSDDSRQDPKPELSLFLPDAIIGAPSDNKFNVKGKDKSGTFGSKFTGNTELAFKAHSAADAQKWFQVIQQVCGATGPAEPNSPTPSSPVVTSPTAAGAAVSSPVTSPVEKTSGEDKLVMNTATETGEQKVVAGTAPTPHAAQEAGVTGGDAHHAQTNAAAVSPVTPTPDEKKHVMSA